MYMLNSSGCSSVAIGRLRFSPLDRPFSLVCYCVAVFLRAAFRSVGLRACTSVWGAAQCSFSYFASSGQHIHRTLLLRRVTGRVPDLRAVGTPVPSDRLDKPEKSTGLTAFGLMASAVMLQGVFSP
ncbi:hypothetical protein EVAR_4867_1 [Eumeta japonica]|uniref:Uncharacterized protein n=1 Tax=Eumeta variegata TaxID=151549 RepID=A0A4C1SZX8_EUMVA|nr:hypothetical protein EVAR_4867_1 [Eumeta japonica]